MKSIGSAQGQRNNSFDATQRVCLAPVKAIVQTNLAERIQSCISQVESDSAKNLQKVESTQKELDSMRKQLDFKKEEYSS